MYVNIGIKEVILLLVDEYDLPIEMSTVMNTIYYIDRQSIEETGTQLTNCTYVRYSSGPHSTVITDAVFSLVDDDLLYQDDSSGQTSFSIDYRSKFESQLKDLSSNAAILVSDCCDEIEELDSLEEEVRSYEEIQNVEKYGRINLQSVIL